MFESVRVNFLTKISTVTGLLGGVCGAIATFSPSYLIENGFVVEPFAWMASSRILLSLAAAGLTISLAVWCVSRFGGAQQKKPGI